MGMGLTMVPRTFHEDAEYTRSPRLCAEIWWLKDPAICRSILPSELVNHEKLFLYRSIVCSLLLIPKLACT